ncbi:hypothetical protein L1987_16584 [Smallanthus sonchifolius]|uniref:Uncharacterized protein n=1 Tax=Smallanthus sonchifolius TaxID=185202 RepID=A0ACB9IW36_9ASTR|nr:hypothetical protein L1987_16584 [Smallanthus sonchifolius]
MKKNPTGERIKGAADINGGQIWRGGFQPEKTNAPPSPPATICKDLRLRLPPARARYSSVSIMLRFLGLRCGFRRPPPLFQQSSATATKKPSDMTYVGNDFHDLASVAYKHLGYGMDLGFGWGERERE